jgi:hypothetical protein
MVLLKVLRTPAAVPRESHASGLVGEEHLSRIVTHCHAVLELAWVLAPVSMRTFALTPEQMQALRMEEVQVAAQKYRGLLHAALLRPLPPISVLAHGQLHEANPGDIGASRRVQFSL